MRRLLIALLLVLATITYSPAQPSTQSIERLTIIANDDEGELSASYCTAFSINQRDGAWITAAHCAGDAYEIDGQALRLVKLDPQVDLMILVGPRAPALKWESRAPKTGDEISASGMAYGTDYLWQFWGRVTFSRLENMEGGFWPVNLVADIKGAPGMSGGPIFSKRHRVISVHQGRWYLSGGLSLALSAPYENVREFTEGYWDR